MSLEEDRPIAEHTVPKEAERASEQASESAQDAPLTKEQFAAQMQLLTDRARAAGLNPLHTLVQTYAKQGMTLLESLLVALEEKADDSKKKGKG